jgi:IS30 family transposase
MTHSVVIKNVLKSTTPNCRKTASIKQKHTFTDENFKLIKSLLIKRLSPEQVAGHIKRHKLLDRLISYETIYKKIWQKRGAPNI